VAADAEVNLPPDSSLETDLPVPGGETMDDNLALLRQALKDLQDAVGTATATQDASLAQAS
jgi:hypothetical protein